MSLHQARKCGASWWICLLWSLHSWGSCEICGLSCHKTDSGLHHIHHLTNFWVCLCSRDVHGIGVGHRGVCGWCVSAAIDCVPQGYVKVGKGSKFCKLCLWHREGNTKILLQPLDMMADQCWGRPLYKLGAVIEFVCVRGRWSGNLVSLSAWMSCFPFVFFLVSKNIPNSGQTEWIQTPSYSPLKWGEKVWRQLVCGCEEKGVQSNLGWKDFSFESLGPSEPVRDRDILGVQFWWCLASCIRWLHIVKYVMKQLEGYGKVSFQGAAVYVVTLHHEE